jgi:solute carrier family 25 S-adenosylmethionine transporter 26
VIKQNAQMLSSDPKSSSSLHGRNRSSTLRTLAQFTSYRQLWRGYTALALRNLPFTGMQYPMFEFLKTKFHARRVRRRGGDETDHSIYDTAFETGSAAAAAGSVSAWLTTPVDVIKTRMMLSANEERPKSAIVITRELLRHEGFSAIWKGAALRAIWTSIGSGLYLGTYEVGKRLLRDRRKDNKGVL